MGEMRGRSVVLLVLSLGLVSAPAATAIGEQVPSSLVFVRDGNVFRTTLDGYETFGLTISASVERSPAVSPDRTRIAFASGRDELWLMNVDGTGARKVLGARPSGVRNASTGSPSWSPRSETIFVPRASRTTGVCSSIFQVGANGRGLRRVTQGVVRGSHESDPAASPNGRLIALSADECGRASRGELEVVTAVGRPTKNLTKLGTTPGAQVAPAWSPDGERLAFEVRDLAGRRSALFVVNRDGSNLRRLTEWPLGARSPDWSPDGASIAFSASGGLYVVGPDGTGLTRIPSTRKGDASPSWLPRS